ncbi:hypothetical protein ACIBG8_14865 [Nonomuraea sp. NPDC050556]|uniref:hypothetical protein n=1 Tax=Nonomuraea sp. NPDC050556 TaxID=3364369 RepID=UPI0037A64126
MTLPLALSLLSLLVTLFALVAVAGVYSRVRILEQTALNPDAARLAAESRTVSSAYRPEAGQVAAVVLLMDGSCAVCHQAWTMAHEREWPELKIVGLVTDPQMAAAFTGGTVVADPGQWRELFEGYAPCMYAIDPKGAVLDRRFVYGDTDVPELLAKLVASRSTHAL